jgi:hypothetical protein
LTWAAGSAGSPTTSGWSAPRRGHDRAAAGPGRQREPRRTGDLAGRPADPCGSPALQLASCAPATAR